MNQQTDVIAEAFSRTAANYDALVGNHPNLTRVRCQVYACLERHIPAGAHIVELNAGSGIDAEALAARGYFVHATDIAAEMLARARNRAAGAQGRMTVQACSFHDLSAIEGAPYDAVFSNFGGLNCIPDLSPVIRQLPRLLKPGGTISWVLMPRLCLWELAEIFRARPRLAFRRLTPGGAPSHLAGLHFTTYYFNPSQVIRWFGAGYTCLSLQGLAVFTPTLASQNFATRYPHFYRALVWLEDRLAGRAPWRSWGDFFILNMRLNP